MKTIRFALASLIVAAFVVLLAAHAQNTSKAGSAFDRFWAAPSPGEAGKIVDDIIKTGVTFDEAWRRLKTGRTYTAQKTGIVKLSNRTNGIEHFYALNVPAAYEPAKRYQVRFQLHGGVGGRESNQPRGTGESPIQGAEQIYVVPYSWNDAPWWSDDQVLNLNNIIDSIKRTYNVDENRVVLSGVSDGGTGAYYIAMRETTPYASVTPLNAFIMVLANSGIDDGQIFPNNLRNKPMFAINGGKDPLYPTSEVEPFVKHLMTGVNIEYHPQPNAGHNTAWWPEMKDTFEKFVATHPRDPHPDKLTWEAASLDHNRAHWLVIDQFGSQPGDSQPAADLNLMRASALFDRLTNTGRMDLVRDGNTIQATSTGVAAFTLLLSPDKFDFNRPIKVVANSRPVFEGRVERNLKTLLKWAAHDNDRTMLYGAELKIKLAR
jgi:poly(3-hydroxybutyrate) depolymerase